MTLKEKYELEIAAAKTDAQRLEDEFSKLPSEFHALEVHVWTSLKEFFTSKG